jgi:hypothetical protein
MADQHQRIDIGFQGGQVLPARVKPDDFEAMRKALAEGSSERWFELQTQDSKVVVDLAQVVYLRIDTEAQRVGF